MTRLVRQADLCRYSCPADCGHPCFPSRTVAEQVDIGTVPEHDGPLERDLALAAGLPYLDVPPGAVTVDAVVDDQVAHAIDIACEVIRRK